jgi:hypothetical protein
MAYLDRDSQGLPILLAEPRKTNPFIERSKRGELPEIVTPDATSGPAEWGRYHDAVREAARSFDAPEEGDIRLFLKARARNPEKVDVPAFHEAVQRQRMADLVDIVDHHMRRDGSLPRGSRHIRTQAPKGYLRRALRHSSPEDIAHLRHRLTSIGHDDQKVSDFLSQNVSGDLWDQATTYEIAAADTEFDGLVFDAGDFEAEWVDPLTDILEAIANIKPEIHIHIDRKDLE